MNNDSLLVSGVSSRLSKQFTHKSYDAPKVIIVDDDKIVATYFPKRNVVEISTKALKICKSFDGRSEDALAFVLGHELAHSVQDKIHQYDIETNFLAYDKYNRARKHLEENADLNGAFASFLAGYDNLDIIPNLLDKLYNDYNLKGKVLSGYPSFNHRVKTSDKIVKQVKHLIHLFDLATYLILFEKYDMAVPLYEEINKSYQGSEVANNKGVNLALAAINLGGYNLDQFIYPLELVSESRLQKPMLDSKSKEIPVHIQRERGKLLRKAQKTFEDVLKISDDEGLLINYFSVLIC